MGALLWWLIPIGTTALAILYVVYRSRPAKPIDPRDSMENLRRLQDAMERPLPDLDPEGPRP